MKTKLLTICLILFTSQVFAEECKGKYWNNCYGTYAFAGEFAGDKYAGEWKDNKMHGQGIYSYANGDKYVGEYKNGAMHGQGTYTFANGDKHVGEFKNGKYVGK